MLLSIERDDGQIRQPLTKTWTIGPEEVLSTEASLLGVPEGPEPALSAPSISRKYTMSVGEVDTTSNI